MAQSEFFDQRAITFRAGAIEVAQHPAALADHLEQSPARMVIVLVDFQMLGQIADTLGQQRNLHLWRPGVALVRPMLLDDLRFGFWLQRHSVLLAAHRPVTHAPGASASSFTGVLVC